MTSMPANISNFYTDEEKRQSGKIIILCKVSPIDRGLGILQRRALFVHSGRRLDHGEQEC